MTETTTRTSGGTVATATQDLKEIRIVSSPIETVTHSGEEHFSGVAVRVNNQPIVLTFEPHALEEQRKTEELNARIRKYGKAF
jgi:hypothetical protein